MQYIEHCSVLCKCITFITFCNILSFSCPSSFTERQNNTEKSTKYDGYKIPEKRNIDNHFTFRENAYEQEKKDDKYTAGQSTESLVYL